MRKSISSKLWNSIVWVIRINHAGPHQNMQGLIITTHYFLNIMKTLQNELKKCIIGKKGVGGPRVDENVSLASLTNAEPWIREAINRWLSLWQQDSPPVTLREIVHNGLWPPCCTTTCPNVRLLNSWTLNRLWKSNVPNTVVKCNHGISI